MRSEGWMSSEGSKRRKAEGVWGGVKSCCNGNQPTTELDSASYAHSLSLSCSCHPIQSHYLSIQTILLPTINTKRVSVPVLGPESALTPRRSECGTLPLAHVRLCNLFPHLQNSKQPPSWRTGTTPPPPTTSTRRDAQVEAPARDHPHQDAGAHHARVQGRARQRDPLQH